MSSRKERSPALPEIRNPNFETRNKSKSREMLECRNKDSQGVVPAFEQVLRLRCKAPGPGPQQELSRPYVAERMECVQLAGATRSGLSNEKREQAPRTPHASRGPFAALAFLRSAGAGIVDGLRGNLSFLNFLLFGFPSVLDLVRISKFGFRILLSSDPLSLRLKYP